MSTKIFDGFQFSTKDLNEVHRFVEKARRKFQPIARRMFLMHLASSMIEIMDRRAVADLLGIEKPGKENSPFSAAFMDYIERVSFVEKENRRDPEIDFSFEVAILPHSTGIYGIVYTEQPELRKLWFASRGIRDFSYFNNTDKPSRISEKEWVRRGETWQFLVGCQPVSDNGFVAKIISVNSLGVPKAREIVPYVQLLSREKRIRNLAMNIHIGREVRKATLKTPDRSPVTVACQAHKTIVNMSDRAAFRRFDRLRIDVDRRLPGIEEIREILLRIPITCGYPQAK